VIKNFKKLKKCPGDIRKALFDPLAGGDSKDSLILIYATFYICKGSDKFPAKQLILDSKSRDSH